MSLAVDTPITTAPTLIQFPSFSETIASVPIVTPAADPAIAESSTIISEEVAVANALRPISSFIEDADDDLDLEEFFAPAKGKGKGKAAPPAASAPPSASAAGTSLPVAGPSSSSHKWLKQIHFALTQKPPQRYGAPEHKANRLALDTLAVGTAGLHDRVEKLNVDLADGLAGFRAQLQGFQADAAEALAHPPASSVADSHAIPSLIESANRPGSNGVAMGNSIRDSAARISQLQDEVTALQATVDSHNHTLKILLARSSASSGTFAAIDDGRKRAREQDEDDHPAHRNAPGVFIPPTFSLPTAPPAPDFASPAFAPPALAVAAPAPLPTAPPTLPRAPPSGPPRVAIDPAREVRLGPMDWEKKWHVTPPQPDPECPRHYALRPLHVAQGSRRRDRRPRV
ncbi:hypothetical protein B0H14DRAFT_246822 [Mycena olivaceomarginata]|nr:hypothetical protein B0H14DRAFT_246822 [Mycena olivaceomarginata]